MKEKKKVNKILIILPIIIVAVLVGVYLYFNNSKNIFTRTLNKGYKNFTDILDKVNVSTDKTIKTSGNVNFNINVSDEYKNLIDQNILDEINKLELLFNSVVSYENKEFSVELNTKYDKNALFDVALYGQNSNLYIELKNLYNKYIEIPVEEYDTLFEEYELEKIEYILNKVESSLLNNLDEKEFVKTKEKLDVESKKIEVNKIEYEFNEEKTFKLLVNTFKELKNDQKFIKYVSEISGLEEKEITDGIDSSIKELSSQTEFEDETFISIAIYTKGLLNEYVGFEININNLGKMKIYNNDDNIYGDLYITGEKVAEITSKKQKENEYKTEIEIKDTANITIDSRITDKSINIDYEIVTEEMSLDGTLNEKITKEENKTTNDSKYNMNIKVEDEVVATININSNIKEELTDEPFTNILSKGKINYENMTEEDMNSIAEKLLSNETIVSFINNIANIEG